MIDHTVINHKNHDQEYTCILVCILQYRYYLNSMMNITHITGYSFSYTRNDTIQGTGSQSAGTRYCSHRPLPKRGWLRRLVVVLRSSTTSTNDTAAGTYRYRYIPVMVYVGCFDECPSHVCLDDVDELHTRYSYQVNNYLPTGTSILLRYLLRCTAWEYLVPGT